MVALTNLAKLIALLFFLGQICNSEKHGNVLYSGEQLLKGDTLNNGNYTLKFQMDCRLVLYDAGKRVWASSNSGKDEFCRCKLDFQGSLDIVSRIRGFLWSSLWTSFDKYYHTEGRYVVILQNDRNLVLYGPILWQVPGRGNQVHGQREATKMIGDAINKGCVLYTGETLYAGESLQSGIYSLVMENDCNLVWYKSGKSLWSTKTGGLSQNCYLRLRNDGNLVVYRRDFKELWTAFDTRKDYGNYVLVLQKWGGIAIYGTPIWVAGTNVKSATHAINIKNTTRAAVL